MAAQETEYCIDCGARLEGGHRFCWSCGAARWTPPEDRPTDGPDAGGGVDAARPPPTPGTAVFDPQPPPEVANRTVKPVDLGLLPWMYAAGAVLFLVQATRALASLLSPAGREQLIAELTRQGVSASVQPGVVTAYWVILITGLLAAAALHGAAFYGLRGARRWGWISALVVAALWSLLIVGIPVLVRLVSRDVRRAFGVD